MDNKDSFEAFLKNKMEGFEQIPPNQAEIRLKNKLKQQGMSSFAWKKVVLYLLFGLLGIGLSWIYYKSNNLVNNKNQALIQSYNLCPLAYATNDTQAKIYNHFFAKAGFPQGKTLFFVNIYDTSKASSANSKQLFSDEKVKNLLQKNFTQIDLYRFEKNNREQIKLFNPNINKTVNADVINLFGDHQFAWLSKDKTWLSCSNYYDYLQPAEFSKLLELVIEEAHQNKSTKEDEILITNLKYQHADTDYEHRHTTDQHSKNTKILVAQTPDDIKNKPYIQARLQAKNEQKMIFLHAFNLDCNHCQKMKDITLANQEVQSFLQAHFVKIDIDLQLLENVEVAQYYDIKTSPKFLFLNDKGQLVVIANGFQEPAKFVALLEKAMEEEAAGSYIDLMSRKRVNPTPNSLQKSHYLKNVFLPDSILLAVAASKKSILINVFEKNCAKCERLEKNTFQDNAVQQIIKDRFSRWIITPEQAKEIGLFQNAQKEVTPTTFIYNHKGVWLTKFAGYMSPKPFIKTLKNPLNNNSIQGKSIQSLKAKIFPNPTTGKFNAVIEGQKSPLLIKIVDLNGKIIFEEKQTEFNGAKEQYFDLTGQQGHYIIQFSQGKSMIYKKVIIQ